MFSLHILFVESNQLKEKQFILSTHSLTWLMNMHVFGYLYYGKSLLWLTRERLTLEFSFIILVESLLFFFFNGLC